MKEIILSKNIRKITTNQLLRQLKMNNLERKDTME